MSCVQASGADWLRNGRVAWLWPAAMLTVVVGWVMVPGIRGDILGAAGFAFAGLLCIGNAVRCRRAHCTATGPLYLVAAGLFLARAAGADIPAAWIVAGAAIGTALAFVPEALGWRYLGRAS